MELTPQQLNTLKRARSAGDRLREELAGRTFAGRDGGALVEVTVDADGVIVEVAINQSAADHADLGTLAHAFVRATNDAQRNATSEGAQRRAELIRHIRGGTGT
ncbi:YbaB/EbfC family nucleoid-associated protein [Saccharopolyspora sp. NPDC002578]